MALLGTPRHFSARFKTFSRTFGHSEKVVDAQIDLGSAYAEGSELEEGSKILGNAFTELAKIENTRGLRRIQNARARLETWKNEPAIRELDERINTGLAALAH